MVEMKYPSDFEMRLWSICNPFWLAASNPITHVDSTTSWLCFYQTRSAWSVDQASNKNHSPAYNFAPTVTKFCVMWEGLSLPHDTKFGNCRCKIVDSRAFPSWSLIHGLRWSGLIKAEPGWHYRPGRAAEFWWPRWFDLSINKGTIIYDSFKL